MPGIKTVFGGGAISRGEFDTAESLGPLFDLLEAGGVDTIDTAQIYGDSEKVLGSANAGKRFTLDTKHPGGAKPGASRDDLVSWAKGSMERLKLDKEHPLDIFYIHGPDPSVPISETLAGINDVYKLGFFKRFGLSNYTAEGVEEIYAHCKEQGYVLPTAFQGNFSAVARRYETLLFPTLRKHNIAFYAYSPLAGGFLAKTKEQVQGGAGRFNNDVLGGMYNRMYNKPAMLEVLTEWEEIAKEAGCSRVDLANRWVKYNSPLSADHGDAIIVGAKDMEQMKLTIDGLKAGPLEDKTVKRIDEIWKKIEHESPIDNFSHAK